ncbi:MAG: TrkA family potassium uptake protein [Dehalococcoidia bacterium]
MYIIVVGGGKVGYYLTKTLLNEGHEVLVIERDQDKCDRIVEELGSVCMRGDGCEATTLVDAGTARAEMLIAVTNEDEDNLVSCQVAKHRFQVPRTIARLNNPKNETIFKTLGIDVTVSSTNLILEHIEQEVPTHPLIHLLTLENSEFEIVEVKIPGGSAAVGKAVKDIELPPGSILSLLIRKGEKPQVPSPETVLEAQDQLVAVTSPEFEEALRLALTSI